MKNYAIERGVKELRGDYGTFEFRSNGVMWNVYEKTAESCRGPSSTDSIYPSDPVKPTMRSTKEPKKRLGIWTSLESTRRGSDMRLISSIKNWLVNPEDAYTRLEALLDTIVFGAFIGGLYLLSAVASTFVIY